MQVKCLAQRGYVNMFIGVALFIGGMVTYYLFSKPSSLKAQQRMMASRMPSKQDCPDLSTIPQSPEGETFTRSVSVTTSIQLLDDRQLGGLNWTSFDLTNNGPNGLYFSVNNRDMPESALPAGETIHVDFKQRQSIKKIYLQSEGTSTALFYVVR